MAAMQVAVTGATGHVGCNLVRALLARGDSVRALVRAPDERESIRGLDLEIIRGDVREEEPVRRLVDGAEVVFHLAAQISIIGPMGGLVHDVNVNGTANVAEACLQAKVRRMLHMCSVHAFEQRPLDEPLDETRERVRPDQAPAYDVSKALGETRVREAIARGLDAVIVHPSGIMGRHDYQPSRMGKVFLDLFHRRLPSLVPGGFDFVDVRDVVDGTLTAVESGRTSESYMLSGHWRSVSDLATLAQQVTGVRPPRFESPMWLARLGAPFMEAWAKLTNQEPLYTGESLLALRANRNYVRNKSQTELGYKPRDHEDTVRDIYEWFVAAGRLPESAVAGRGESR